MENWITLDKTSGNNNDNINISAINNPDTGSRSTIITVKGVGGGLIKLSILIKKVIQILYLNLQLKALN